MVNIRSTGMERVLRSILKEKCGGRLWKVVKRNKFLEAIYSIGVRYKLRSILLQV